jgi:phosphatidylserine/phosphatidylglycerophosphate/cardiolipin synthase-like enzyme
MKKIIFVILMSLWILQESPSLAEMEPLFSPGGGIKERLLKEIENTHSSIDLAISAITSLDLAHALLKAKHRGVKIRIIADSKQAKMKSSLITYLINQGIPSKVLGGKERGVMNHRFAILDGKKVIVGSYEWSEASERWNYENLLILSDPEGMDFFQKEFDRLWREKRVIE